LLAAAEAANHREEFLHKATGVHMHLKSANNALSGHQAQSFEGHMSEAKGYKETMEHCHEWLNESE
jgi:hypothetical protein